VRVVLDTNVIVSGLNFPGNERMVLDITRRGMYELILSSFILDETVGVLLRKFHWEESRLTQAIQMMRDSATIIEPPRRASIIDGNHADNRILDCVVEASADFLVTGDRRHLLPLEQYEGTRIVNASKFIRLLYQPRPSE
jgi:putative PIN family toxin of toxin-antitoxin system